MPNTSFAWLTNFLSVLPEQYTVQTWLQLFRDALRDYLPGVSRITVDVNVNALDGPDSAAGALSIVHARQDSDAPSPPPIVDRRQFEATAFESVIQSMEHGGFQAKEYHPPLGRDYRAVSGAYLGTVLLWAARSRPPVDEETRIRLTAIDSIVRRLMVDCAVLHQRAHRLNQPFLESLREMIARSEITPREQVVATLRLLGREYGEIAKELGISQNTVARHVNAIHRKTGTRSLNELFQKLFSGSFNAE